MSQAKVIPFDEDRADPIVTNEESYADLDEGMGGFCLSCKAEAYGVEPDARRYKCEECGELAVFGAQELLIMGKLEFQEDGVEG
jgi:hypothetical protein